MFGRFGLRVPEWWTLQNLVVGSAHLNNTVASEKRGRTRFAKAAESHCDIVGLDLNQGLGQLSDELRLFIQRNNLQPVATDLLGRRERLLRVAGAPGSQLLTLELQRHGHIPCDHRGLRIRMYDADSHYTLPSCFTPSTTVVPEEK